MNADVLQVYFLTIHHTHTHTHTHTNTHNNLSALINVKGILRTRRAFM